MTGSVVGVHGIGNAGDPRTAGEALGALWTRAVRRGLPPNSTVTVTMAYYADLLLRDAAQSPAEPEVLEPPEQRLLLAWAAELGAPDEIAQGRLTAPVRAAVDWISRRFGLDSTLVRRFVAVTCREVLAYLEDPERRAAVRARVADCIAASEPRAVLAHSLGSVVTYEALWAHPGLHVDLLVTLGSPLAMPSVILPRLEPAPCPGVLARPPGVRRWINIADPGDIVAIPRDGLGRTFTGVDADLSAGVGVVDFHRATGYLACGTTAGVLAATL